MEENAYVFVSYARKNSDEVKKIVEALEQLGMRVYIDYRDIPPGSVFAEEIVNAIENSICCVLIYTFDSNKSGFVLNEMNSAVNHNKTIIPLRLDETTPSKAMEFYIGKNNWVDYIGMTSLETLIKAVNNIKKSAQENVPIRYKGPIVLRAEALEEIGYNVEKRLIETIEIDYKTLGDAPTEYLMNEEIEGTIDDWFDYARSYPETGSMLVVNDRIVGYSQIELITEENFDILMTGEVMITSEMEEFYGFGGEFYCYIAIMPILSEYETQKNYLMLLDDLFAKMVAFSEDDIEIVKYGISVYTQLLESMVTKLGFRFVCNNPAGGKVFQLDRETILTNPVYKRKYNDFYRINGGE